jgi:hypothetical protein
MPISARAGDQRLRRSGEAGERRGGAEGGEADEQCPLAAELVAEATRGEQESGEHEQVRVDDPLQLAGRGTEPVGERGQGDVHDRAVDHHDEDGEAHDRERGPASRMAGHVSLGGRWEFGDGHGGLLGRCTSRCGQWQVANVQIHLDSVNTPLHCPP